MNSFDTAVQCEEVFDGLDDRSNTVSHPSNVVPLETPAHDDGIRRLARPTDPATSHKAAASVKQRTIQKLYKTILELCTGLGTTDHELVATLEFRPQDGLYEGMASPSGIRTRRHELFELGCLHVLAQRRITEPNKIPRLHNIWATTDLGDLVLNRLDEQPALHIQDAIALVLRMKQCPVCQGYGKKFGPCGACRETS